MVLPLIIALAVLAGSLAFFKDDISNIFNKKSEAEKERERQDAKVRDEKGAFGNTSDFLFGEKKKIPKTPEELQVEKKINERGVFANIQAFLFGEQSLEASNNPPILGSGESSEKNTTDRLKLNQHDNSKQTKANVIINTKSRRQQKSTNLIQNQNEIKINSQAGQKSGETNKLGVAGTPPSENQNNVIPKDVRKGRNTFTQTKVIKAEQPTSKEETQKATQPSENKNNVVSKSRRLSSQTRNPAKTENNEIPIEQREDSVKIG
jgi:hypothetical protein